MEVAFPSFTRGIPQLAMQEQVPHSAPHYHPHNPVYNLLLSPKVYTLQNGAVSLFLPYSHFQVSEASTSSKLLSAAARECRDSGVRLPGRKGVRAFACQGEPEAGILGLRRQGGNSCPSLGLVCPTSVAWGLQVP